MASLNLDLDYFDHPKTRRLVGLLGKDAEILPIRLWCYCGRYHYEDGKLSGYSASEIESLSGWKGQPGKAIDAMVKVGLLDVAEDGTYSIHDWQDHAGHIRAFKERSKKANQARIKKLTSNACGGTQGLLEGDLEGGARTAASGPLAVQCSAVQGKALQGKANAPPNFADSPEGIAQEFWFHQHPKKDDEFAIGEEITSMVEAGYSLAVIRNGIRAKRDRSEFFWQFKKRLEKESPPGTCAKASDDEILQMAIAEQQEARQRLSIYSRRNRVTANGQSGTKTA